MCPYCQKSLVDLVYWEHLEEHMGSSNTSPSTPTARTTSKTPTPRTPSTPVTPVKAEPSPKTGSPDLKPPVKSEVSPIKVKDEVDAIDKAPEVKEENISDIIVKEEVYAVKEKECLR